MDLFLGIVVAVIILGVGWAVMGFAIVREDELAVVVELGKPVKVIGSGWHLVRWPIQYLRRFTTNLIKLNFRPATIITKAGEFDGIEYGEANVVIEPSLYFLWPEDNRLIKTLRVVGNPQNENGLRDLFEETVLDAFRSVGGLRTWRDISQNRESFAKDVFKALIDNVEDPIRQAELQKVQLVIRHLTLPEKLAEAITKPEVARLEAKKKVIEAKADRDKAILDGQGNKAKIIAEGEGNKEKITKEGEGYADARAKLFTAIGSSPESLQMETLLTLREMAKGTSNTIFIPTEVADALKGIGKATKNSDLQAILTGLGLDKSKIDQVMKAIGSETK